MYRGLMDYLQQGIGDAAHVDAYLLQACKMPSPKKDQAAIERLAACVHDRRH